MVSPDLDPDAIRRALLGRRFGASLTVVDETGSTNTDMREAALAGAGDGSVIIAEHQTAGRGRAGRTWDSPPRRGILLSALVVPVPAHVGSLLPLAAGLAVCDSLAATAPLVSVGLKWPNDIVASSRKLGGILVEGEAREGRLVFAVIGIGINVQHSERELPPGATSLALEGEVDAARGEIVIALLRSLEDRIEDVSLILPAYRDRCVTLGRRVSVEARGGQFDGLARDLDETGALIVETRDGDVAVTLGDVFHLG